MISALEAKNIALQYILGFKNGDELQLIESLTIEKPFGWVFFYQSRKYLETKEFRYMLAGNAPIIVDRDKGAVHATGTAHPIDDYILEFEKNYWLK